MRDQSRNKSRPELRRGGGHDDRDSIESLMAKNERNNDKGE